MDVPFILNAETVTRLRKAFAAGTSRAACSDCQWKATCDAIAAGGFEDVLLFSEHSGL
jgi:hypothetical protein